MPCLPASLLPVADQVVLAELASTLPEAVMVMKKELEIAKVTLKLVEPVLLLRRCP